MKQYVFGFFTFIFSFAAFGGDVPGLRPHMTLVLALRVTQVASYRIPALRQCAARTGSQEMSRLADRIERSLGWYDEEGVLLQMELYQESFFYRLDCKKEFETHDGGLLKAERTKFSFPHRWSTLCLGTGFQRKQCVAQAQRLWSDLDPRCALNAISDFDVTDEKGAVNKGIVDQNPCFLDLKGLAARQRYVDPDQEKTDRFLRALFEAIQNLPDKDGVLEWTSLYGKFGVNESREDYLGRLAAVSLAGGPGLGYVTGIGDYYWRYALEDGRSPEQALKMYETLKWNMDYFIDLKRWITDKKKARTTLNGIDVSGANHHNFSAAYLACKYRKQGQTFAEGLPYLLGLGYESKDFLANQFLNQSQEPFWRRAGNNLKEFNRDVERYSNSAQAGYAFCNLK